MRITIQRHDAQRMLLWMASLFLFAGLAGLGYWASFYAEGAFYQWRYDRAFDRVADRSEPQQQSEVVNSKSHAATGAAMARLEIPRLGLSTMVLEGTDERTLRRGVGHIPGTALPGESGNVSLAGHRDTFFRALRGIHKHDLITLTTVDGSMQYQVETTAVVGEGNVQVLNPSKDSELTLVTCYPFDFVGPAPSRFIVRARQMK